MVYLPGNHDEFLRVFHGTHFGGIEVTDTVIHVAPDGRRYLVLHGDTRSTSWSRTRLGSPISATRPTASRSSPTGR